MPPIHELLSRIRWDRDFGTGFFEIGYLDHIEEKIIRIPFREIHFQEGNRFAFQLENGDGEMVAIPFHRVKEVYRDGMRIWERPG
jgi:uncharacterized protein (UPF0248 family)